MLVSIGPYAKFSPSRVPQPPYPQVSSGLQAVVTGAREVTVPEIYTGNPIMTNGLLSQDIGGDAN